MRRLIHEVSEEVVVTTIFTKRSISVLSCCNFAFKFRSIYEHPQFGLDMQNNVLIRTQSCLLTSLH